MVTRTSIKRISAEIDALAEKLQIKKRMVVISCPDILDPDKVKEKHYELFPEDRDAEFTIFICNYDVEDIPEPGSRKDCAWHHIIREENASIPAAELRRSRALRVISASLEAFQDGNEPFNTHSRAALIGQAVGRYDFPEAEAIAIMRGVGIPTEDEYVMSGYRRALQDERKAA